MFHLTGGTTIQVCLRDRMQCVPSVDSSHQFKLCTMTWTHVTYHVDNWQCHWCQCVFELSPWMTFYTGIWHIHTGVTWSPRLVWQLWSSSHLVYTNQQSPPHSTRQTSLYDIKLWTKTFLDISESLCMNTHSNYKSDGVVCEYHSNGTVPHAHPVKITSNKIVFWCVQKNWQCRQKNDTHHTILT